MQKPTFYPLSIDRNGIWFYFEGDEVLWTWFWRRKGLPKWISLNFSGDGSLGDARFHSLKEISQAWNDYFLSEEKSCCNGPACQCQEAENP